MGMPLSVKMHVCRAYIIRLRGSSTRQGISCGKPWIPPWVPSICLELRSEPVWPHPNVEGNYERLRLDWPLVAAVKAMDRFVPTPLLFCCSGLALGFSSRSCFHKE